MAENQVKSEVAVAHEKEVQRGERFQFGQNWREFLNTLDDERIAVAEASLKGMLGKANVFNYPRLAASYRYGFAALRRQGFLVSKMKTPKNRIYRKIFAGEIRPVKTPSD